MAAELVVGALLSASLDGLLKRMASPQVLQFFKQKRLGDQKLKKMKLKLLSANAVLNDAEKKQIDNPNVKKWLEELQEIITDAEDLMDSINTSALRRKVEGESISFKVPRMFSATKGTVQKSHEILDLLEYILNEKDELGLQCGVQNMLLQRTPTTSLVEESGVWGRNSDKEAIIEILLSDEIRGGNNMCVIPIVGMGGVGKTTLAQLIYNDDRVRKFFDTMAWVSVSEHFDILRITKIIVEEVTKQTVVGDNLNMLQKDLKEKILKGKKFLLILDDVWNERYESWTELKKAFESVAWGSKIIVTTRNEGVASVMRDVPSYQLGTLSGDDCWSLFVRHAFNNVVQPSVHPKLEEIGRKIVHKCQGLPLAIKTLGGLLRYQLNPEEWIKILNSDLWELPKEKNSILPVLWISYHYLPGNLKRCFSYCSIFPKNHEISKDQLIKLWMASSGRKGIEEVGEEYFDELISRSLFHQSKDRDGSIHFGMHDLVNDLATFLSGEICLRWHEVHSIKPSRKVRYLSCLVKQHSGPHLDEYKNLLRDRHKQLRTVFSLPFLCSIKEFAFSSLRVLSLGYSWILELPDSIKSMKALRYLDLSSSSIEELPNTVCILYNLQTLILRNCSRLKRLPADMRKLINLRHLDLDYKVGLHMPLGICNFKDLQTLPYFTVSKTGGTTIKELQNLQFLRGSLRIFELENVVDVEDVSMANLKDKQYLSHLEFNWSITNHGGNCCPLHEQVLDRLQPHTNIKSLKIASYLGERFPNWFRDHSFCSLELICLLGFKRCYLLPSFGQLPFLKELEIKGFDGLTKIGDEFYCDMGCSIDTKPYFRCLEVLRIQDMPEWKEWSFIEGDGVDHFPSLKKLNLSNCPKLSGGLCLLETLETVQLSKCSVLEFPGKHCYASLKEMEIKSSCHFMKSIHLDHVPVLNKLRLEDLQRLGSLTLTSEQSCGAGFQFHYLRWFELNNCPVFVSFPQVGLPAPNLEDFSIKWCDRLSTLPDHMNTLLPSLRSLDISNCPALESFGEGGLPSNLSKLSLDQFCKNFACGIQNWNLQTVTYLSELSITSRDKLDSFPQEGLLPTSLIKLSIKCFHLKALNGKALLSLVSLKELCIKYCNALKELTPHEKLPATLTSLVVEGCPYLRSRCLRDTGEDWQKIAHIPHILLDYEEI